ncbi:MAG: leucine-rich repeat protein [Clostridiales Family XIII bacterium]|jgi:hypothetical protein|nr:leucine-rich repeat protein [Clostridiales Family XIII bacterium]
MKHLYLRRAAPLLLALVMALSVAAQGIAVASYAEDDAAYSDDNGDAPEDLAADAEYPIDESGDSNAQEDIVSDAEESADAEDAEEDSAGDNDGDMRTQSAFSAYSGAEDYEYISTNGDTQEHFTVSAAGVLTGYNGAGGNVVIPAYSADGIKVVNIGEYAFYNCASLKTVEFPDGLDYIWNFAFQNCTSLETVTIPDGLTQLGSYTFGGCTSLTSVDLPDSLTNIASFCFRDCTSLNAINLPNSITIIRNYVFAGCSSLETFDFPKNITQIVNNAFKDCVKLHTVDLSMLDQLTSIDNNAFDGCTALATVSLPNDSGKLTSINYDAFQSTALTNITLPSTLTTIGARAFENTLISSIDIPENVKTLGGDAFANTGVTNAELKNPNITINGWPFDDNGVTVKLYSTAPAFITATSYSHTPAAENIIIELYDPENITYSGDFVIRTATDALILYTGAGGDVVIPEGVTKIGGDVFRLDYSLYPKTAEPVTSVSLPSSLVEIEYYAFMKQSELKSVELPASLRILRGFEDTGLEGELVIPAGVSALGGFYGTKITSAKIRSDAESPNLAVDSNTFQNSPELLSISCERPVTLASGVFNNCPKLTTVSLPKLTGMIPATAFQGCASLTELVIPEGVTGTSAGSSSAGIFKGTQIRELAFPSTFRTVGNYIFLGARTIENIAFLNKDALTINTNSFNLGSNANAGLMPTAVYVYPESAAHTSLSNASGTQNAKVKNILKFLTRTVRATVQDKDAAGFGFRDEITAEWNDWDTWDDASGTGENISPSFEPTVLDAWARVNKESVSAQPDFAAFTLNGVLHTREEAGATAVLEGDALHFIPADMTAPWFLYNGGVVQSLDTAPGIGYEFTLTSQGGPVANMPLYFADISTGVLTDTGLTTDNLGRFTLKLDEDGVYVITPYDSENKVAFNFLTLVSARAAKLGTLAVTGSSPAFSAEPILGRSFAAGTLTKAGEITPVVNFDPNHFDYDFYVNHETTSVTFSAAPLIPEMADDAELTVSGSNPAVNGAAPEDGVWAVTVPLTGAVTPVVFAVRDTETDRTVEYTVSIKRAVTYNGEDMVYLAGALDMALLSEVVGEGTSFDGVTFRLTNDISLPADWNPIGSGETSIYPSQTAGQVRIFGGTIDGAKPDGSGSYTITFAPGSRPLLKYARGTTVRNLNIYGEDINGNGLVEIYFVDYGSTGHYADWLAQHRNTLDVDNLTILEGTNIRRSGILGGGASGSNTVNIKNSTIEKGVRVGYNAELGASSDLNKIGSFAGDFNGKVVNCVSYADVYGAGNVGGLVGSKGQSMGLCDIIGSSFHGDVYATGSYVGGIIGAGYNATSGPNSPCVVIENCYVTGSISGNNRVGGIFGGEGGVQQCWANGIGYIRNNHFAGTISANGDQVGGIIGFMHSLNKYNIISNNYYLDSSGAARAIGAVRLVDTNKMTTTTAPDAAELYFDTSTAMPGIESVSAGFAAGVILGNLNRDDDPLGADADSLGMSVTAAQLADGSITARLNAGEGSLKNWAQGSTYPVHNPYAETAVYKLEIGGEYKSIYYLGESFDAAGMEITAHLTDGTTRNLTPDQVSFEGFVSDATGSITVTAAHGGAKTLFTVSVIKQYDDGNTGNTGRDGISVRFVLIGSTLSKGSIDLTDGNYKGAVYEEWIPMRTYTMDRDATVLELFVRALGGLEFSIRSNDNYIDKIKNPVTGAWLSEFTNGQRSGWMYTVGKNANGSDGKHPGLGLREYVMSDGDVIIWHYVNDYAYEVEDWFDEPEYPSLATDDTYYNAWLSVLPNSGVTVPPAGTPDSGDSVPSTEIKTEESLGGAGGGTAKAEVKAEDVTAAVDKAKEDKTTAVSVTVKGDSNTKIADVILPKASAKEIADNGLEFVVKSPVGDVSFGKEALDTITARPGDTLEVVIADEGKTDVIAANNEAFSLTVKVGDTELTSLGGTVAVALPYAKAASEDAELLTVYKLEEDGTYTEIKDAKYNAATGKADFTTTETGSYFVSEWISPFEDIDKSAWYYKAVRYAYASGLMNGTGDGAYSPQATLTRAMLITILAREAGIDTDGGDTWYSKAVEWGIANGITDGENPDGEITREQFAAMLYRYADSPRTSGGFDAYYDAGDVSAWAEEAMAWAVESGLITGRTETTLAPSGTATRAEAAAMLQRYLEKAI